MRFSVLFAVIAFIVAVSAEAPLFRATNEPVESVYVIVFKPESTKADRDSHLRTLLMANDPVFQLRHKFDIINGYSARLSDSLLSQVLNMPNIDYVEESQVYRINRPVFDDSSCSLQTNAGWNLNRASERALNLDGRFIYHTGQGQGVTAYIIDTGIYTAHVDFGGRATWGTNTADKDNTDGNGHGTHVAGTVASATYGFAKNATLVAVKVLGSDGSGTTDGVIAGINWAAADHTAKKNLAVANLSLGGGKSTALNTALDNLVKAGVTTAVAAGNENANACNTSPASAALAITTGATANTDARASFSNYGSCLDIFSPGQNIKSTWIGSNTATNTISGTSMASPATAGVAAVILSLNPTFTPAQVEAALLASATTNVVTSPGSGSPNKLLYSACD